MELNIFTYTNYRDFLKDYYDSSKENNKNFSYRYFAKKAGFTSSNFLYLVIHGKRNLTKDYVPKFASAMGLSKLEQRYFEALTSFNQAKSPEAKRYYLELLYNLKRNQTGKLLNDQQYEYISNWYYPVIREMVLLPSFKENPTWIRKELGGRVSTRQIRDALETLIRLDLVRRNEEERLVQTDQHVVTEEEVMHAAAHSFHQQMLSLAKEVLKTVAGDEREISGVTMALSPKQFKEIKRMIHEFEDKILNYLSTDPDMPEKVYQINMQLFPVTGQKGK